MDQLLRVVSITGSSLSTSGGNIIYTDNDIEILTEYSITLFAVIILRLALLPIRLPGLPITWHVRYFCTGDGHPESRFIESEPMYITVTDGTGNHPLSNSTLYPARLLMMAPHKP